MPEERALRADIVTRWRNAVESGYTDEGFYTEAQPVVLRHELLNELRSAARNEIENIGNVAIISMMISEESLMRKSQWWLIAALWDEAILREIRSPRRERIIPSKVVEVIEIW